MSFRSVAPGRRAGRIEAPPSKSYTHRALVVAYLGRRRCRIDNPLDAEDTRRTAAGLARLGARIRRGRGRWDVAPGRTRPRPDAPVSIDCGESGTTLRFLTAVAAAESRRVHLSGAPSLARRPMGPLLDLLGTHGVEVRGPRSGRSLPFTVEGPLKPGNFALDPSASSQFLSALLLVLPTLERPSRVRLTAPAVSRPYVAATQAVLRAAGVRVERRGPEYVVPAPQRFAVTRLAVPGDASSAAYFWAAGAVSGGDVRVDGVPRGWPQADLRILDVLARAGATVTRGSTFARVRGGPLRPFAVDLTDAPDLFPLLGAVASVTPGTSRLLGASQVALKESDRRSETASLARAFGAAARSARGGLEIRGHRPARPSQKVGSPDHRVVMSAAVAATAAEGASSIGDARAVAKSYPGFWTAFARLGPDEEAAR